MYLARAKVEASQQEIDLEQRQIDWTTFATCVGVILLVCLPLAVFPDAGGKIILTAYTYISTKFGFLYMLAGIVVIIFLARLAFGRYGGIVLGDADDQPEFSDYSWAAMLFCAGIGGGLIIIAIGRATLIG